MERKLVPYTFSLSKSALFIVILTLLIGCETQQSRFKKAGKANTITAYETFLNSYPEGKYSEIAKQLLEELEYKKADSISTIDSYLTYLKKYPRGKDVKPATKKYIARKVETLYIGVTRDPLKEIGDNMMLALKSKNILAEQKRLDNEYQNKVIAFTKQTAKTIREDPYLTNYFIEFIKRLSDNKNLTIETLNYYGVNLRIQLESELGIDIVDSRFK